MTQDHPITPSLELVEIWYAEAEDPSQDVIAEVAIKAARWGADMELEACCEWLDNEIGAVDPCDLRADRRPKPPSLKEQALDSWDRLRNEAWCEEIDFDLDFIRRALEQLPNQPTRESDFDG